MQKNPAHLGRNACVSEVACCNGCAEIARDVFAGEKNILGVDVNYP